MFPHPFLFTVDVFCLIHAEIIVPATLQCSHPAFNEELEVQETKNDLVAIAQRKPLSIFADHLLFSTYI